MPEMKGRSLEELDEIFAARTPAWKFKEFQTIIRDEAAHDMREHTGIELDKNQAVEREEVEVAPERQA